jgi:hypothetical protein
VDRLFSPDVRLEFTIYLLICNFLALQTEFEDSKNSVRSLLQFVKTKIFWPSYSSHSNAIILNLHIYEVQIKPGRYYMTKIILKCVSTLENLGMQFTSAQS